MLFKQTAFRYSLLLFIFSRAILAVIGYLTINEFHLHELERYSCGQYSQNSLLGIFGNYDTGWYLELATNWYPKLADQPEGATFAQYNFFPLYPALMNLVHFVTRSGFFISGLLISNVCLIGSGVLIYKIGEQLFNEQIAKSAVVFLYAFPLSFLFSGAYSESLYLFLLLLSLYWALKNNWLLAGIAGFLIVLSRPPGVFIILPLLAIYLKSIRYSLSSIKKEILFLLFIPLGVMLVLVQNYVYTGDPIYFLHNPHFSSTSHASFLALFQHFSGPYSSFSFFAAYTLIHIIIWVVFYRRIPLAFHLIILYSMLVPLCFGLMSMPRMLAVAFPFLYILSGVAVKYKIEQPLLITLTLFQGFLAVCWFLGFGMVV